MAVERATRSVTIHEPEAGTPFPGPLFARRDPAGFYTLRDRTGVVIATINAADVDRARFEATVAQLMADSHSCATLRAASEYRPGLPERTLREVHRGAGDELTPGEVDG
jgi:hypothetical protein